MRETLLQSKVMARLNRVDSPCRVWRNNVGRYPTAGGGWVAYGLAVGSADLIGIVIPTGQFLSIEMKTPVGRLSPEQKTWKSIIQRMGGLAMVIRSVEEAEALIAELSKLRPICLSHTECMRNPDIGELCAKSRMRGNHVN